MNAADGITTARIKAMKLLPYIPDVTTGNFYLESVTGITEVLYGSARRPSSCLYCKSISDVKANCRNCGAPVSSVSSVATSTSQNLRQLPGESRSEYIARKLQSL